MHKLYLILIALLVFALSSCDRENNYPKNSVLGSWRCTEEGSTHGYRQYSVDIVLQGADSSQIKLLNFYNLGYSLDDEVYATIQDTVIIIMGTGSFVHDFSGTGHFERDYSAIYWEFSYFGQTASDPQVEALFRRP